MNCIWTFSDSQHASGPCSLVSCVVCAIHLRQPYWQDFASPPEFLVSTRALWSPCTETMHLEMNTHKTCYPLLRGIFHIVTKDWLSVAFICSSERITHCYSGRIFLFVLCYFFYTLDIPFPLIWAKKECCLTHTGVKRWGTVWYMWVVEIFLLLLLQEGHSGLRVIRKLKRGY